jgi:hypothetical protein
MRRGSCVAFKCIKVLDPKPELMPLYCVWLKKLKFSQRNSKPVFSLILNRLKVPKSKLTRPGKLRVLRPTSPNVSHVGIVYAAGLYASGPRFVGS